MVCCLNKPNEYGQPMKKILIVVTAALLAFGFFALDLNHYLTLEGMKASLGHFQAQRAA